jgi:integrase
VRARRPERLPVVLTRHEVAAVLCELSGRERIMATLLYGSGLRLVECSRLRIKEIDFEKREILVRGGKGDKDRMTMLPEAARVSLIHHLDGVRRQYEADLAKGFGGATLPGAIGRKYPNAAREWAWQYVFPASRLCVDRATGHHLRHHLDETVLQRAVREAVRRAKISKSASCHTLRHSFAHPSPRERIRHSHRPGAPRPPRREHDHDLHPRPQPRRPRSAESRRWTVSRPPMDRTTIIRRKPRK